MKGTRYRKSFATTVVLAAVSRPVLAAAAPDRPTYTKDVLPLIQEHCQECHRAAGANVMGMVAPMSFMSYQEVRPWAKGIARQVKARTMPYDNSETRAEWAGFDPTRTVRFGQPTWDEMMFGWIDYTDSEVAAPDTAAGGR